MQERSNSNTFRELYETAQLDMEAPRAASIFEEPGPAHSRSVRLPRGWRCPGGMNGRLVQPPRLRGSALRAPRMCGYVFNNHVAMSTLSFTFSRSASAFDTPRGVSDIYCLVSLLSLGEMPGVPLACLALLGRPHARTPDYPHATALQAGLLLTRVRPALDSCDRGGERGVLRRCAQRPAHGPAGCHHRSVERCRCRDCQGLLSRGCPCGRQLLQVQGQGRGGRG